jgi:hypothetical protein
VALGIVFLVVILAAIVRVTLVHALLVRYHYDVHSFLGREPGDAIWVAYEEGRQLVEFFGSRDERLVAIPDEAAWVRLMPPWATGRRAEIVGRLRRHADRVRVTLRDADRSDGLAILWSEKQAGGRAELHRIEW